MKTVIAWWAKNRVAANILLVVMMAGGLLSIPSIKKEIFPEFSTDTIKVSVEYLGAAPEEVEESICVRIEEEVYDLDGIKKLRCEASEGIGTVTAQLVSGTDDRKLLDEIKTRVDAIDTFPEETEKPVIELLLERQQVINVALAGDVDEATLKRLAEQMRDELSALPGVTQVDLIGIRPDEISIEVSERALRRYEITFDEVVQAVRRSSLDLPGGSIKAESGDILLRTKGQAYRGEEFERLVLRTRPDGTRLFLKDVATVIDGFAEIDQSTRFDGVPSVFIRVFRVGDQNVLDVAQAVREYVAQVQPHMPDGIVLTTWGDFSTYFESRLNLLIRNGITGLALVFLILIVFLRFRLALWVSLGIPASFLGAIWLMPMFDASINMISLFAFILVLGIVVDDAIVVGENIYTHQQRGKPWLQSAIDGAHEVAVPVTFAVLTTVVAFIPLLMVAGVTGKIWGVIPLIVIPALLFSLIESQLVLPAHLSYRWGLATGAESKSVRINVSGGWIRFQGAFERGLDWFILNVYRPSLAQALRWRYVTLSAFIAVFVMTLGLVFGGWIKFVFLPNVEADYAVAVLTMPRGTSADVTSKAVAQLERSALALRDELEEGDDVGQWNVFRHIMGVVGRQPYSEMQRRTIGQANVQHSSAHLGEVTIELVLSEQRTMSSEEIVNRWRTLTGPIPDAVELTFSSTLFDPGKDINVQLTGPDIGTLREAAAMLKRRLETYAGIYEITDSFREGAQEITLAITPAAETLGLTLADLGRQVRQGFYGEETQRVQRGRDDVRVMVRYPADHRRSLGDLEKMKIRTPAGDEVPFSSVAVAAIGRGPATITRVDRLRTVNVTANVDTTQTDTNVIVAELVDHWLPEILAQYRGLRYSLEGQQREQQESLEALGRGFLYAVIGILALMAIPLRSYVQPLIIISAIPFGIVGAVMGHLILGMALSIFSMLGIIALAGVVVNDNLVLVDFVNRSRAAGQSIFEAVHRAGISRFRPILLTSLTTFGGLLPMLMETSTQAQFLIPMAATLAFGVMFSTVVSLVFVPSLYMVLEDIKDILRKTARFVVH